MNPNPSTILQFGIPIDRARRAVILLHGRGSSGEDIAGLADALPAEETAFLAPTAADGTWYPHRFFAPLAQNEPWLSNSLRVVDDLVRQVESAGVAREQIGFVGFSQGACLALEHAARHPDRYGFIAALSGALIGPLDTARDPGDLQGTPVLLGCAERDAHIPLPFVEQSAQTLAGLKAVVTKRIFRGSAHTVFPEEIAWLHEQMAALARLH